jgi:hypothetical protein
VQFSRRSIQASLDQIRSALSNEIADALVAKLNRADAQRLPAVWEAVYLASLSRLGRLDHEHALPSGRKPDIRFTAGPGQIFVADITAPSDKGIDDSNPVDELNQILRESLKRLKIEHMSIHLETKGKEKRSAKGRRVFLKLPERKRLRDFVRSDIEPLLRTQLKAGASRLTVTVETDEEDLLVRVDNDRHSTMSHPTFDLPTVIDENPLFSALCKKAQQLGGAEGLLGIITCDADCTAMSERSSNSSGHSRVAIVRDVMRQYSRLDFVLLTTVRQLGRSQHDRTHAIDAELVPRADRDLPTWVYHVLKETVKELPQPKMTPVNARYRAEQKTPKLGFHGGGQMSNKRLKLSSRMLMEALSGRLSVTEMNEQQGWVAGNPFEQALTSGRLPVMINVEKTDDNDDWITIEWGSPDPAISKFV